MFSLTSPYGSTCDQNKGGESAFVLGREHTVPFGVGEDVLDHQHIDIDQGGLADP
jgi:hypothetical protein